MGKGTKRPRTSESTATPDQTLVPDRAKAASGSNASASAAGRAAAAGSTSEGGRKGGKGGEQRQGGKGKPKSVTAVEEWDPLDAKAVVLTMDEAAVDEEAGEQAVNDGDGAALMKWLLAPMPPGALRAMRASDAAAMRRAAVLTPCSQRVGHATARRNVATRRRDTPVARASSVAARVHG